jgi:hypothetical protein
MHQLNVTLCEHIWDGMVSFHAELQEFSMHRSADMNISLLYFLEFFTLEEQELERIS